MRIQSPRIQGFTLLELLVVITLLAVLASVALLANDGVNDQAELDATKFEMAELRKALLQFRRDSGSNHFPNQGAYVCEDPDNPGQINPALVAIKSGGSLYSISGSSDAERLAWCQSAANFWMLFHDPYDRPVNSQWDPDTKRGWHGPYLTRSGPSYVDVGTIIEGTLGSESTGTLIQAVRGIADGFSASPVGTYLAWRVSPLATAGPSNGRPYLMFDLDNGDARIVSLGEDGDYDGTGSTACEPPLDSAGKSADIVLCLLK